MFWTIVVVLFYTMHRFTGRTTRVAEDKCREECGWMDFASFPAWAVVTAPFILAEAPVLVLAPHSACHFTLHTHTHTQTQTSNPPEPCLIEVPATAHEICLYHLVAVKVLVWTTMSGPDPQTIKEKKDWEEASNVIVYVHVVNLTNPNVATSSFVVFWYLLPAAFIFYFLACLIPLCLFCLLQLFSGL